jgi:hypothetical protein
LHDDDEFDRVLTSGQVLFAIEIPRDFERAPSVAAIGRRFLSRQTPPTPWPQARHWRTCLPPFPSR